MAYTTIDDPSKYFNTILYTGNNAANRSITGAGLQPDWGWLKQRNGTGFHELYDSSRGVTKALSSNTSDAEATTSALDSFDSDGITVSFDSNNSASNGNGKTAVWWLWKANGGTTSSNTNGSITTTVQANTTAGFSIVTYTSAAGGQTIGHGLGVKPDMYIIKERTTSGDDWFVYHSALGEGKKLRLSGTSAAESDTNIWQNTAPTTTVAYLQNDGGGVNQNTGGNQNYVGYFFNNIQGYSKFGTYTGNGNADGPFVYTGFRPAFLIVKNTSITSEWMMWDNKRDTFNVVDARIYPNRSYAEGTGVIGDFLSNGVKIRNSGGWENGNGNKIIYMAFAENPFVSSKGVPVTAR